MIEQFARKITEAFIKYNYIHDLQREDYIYAITMFIEKIITIVTILLLAVYFRLIISTLFFLFFLSVVKKRCGGFHTNSFKTCFLLTITIYIVFVLFFMPIMERELNITYILFAISIVILELIGAVNNPNINWNKEEYKESKKASRICVIMEGIMITAFIFLDANSEIIVSMIFAIILNALSLLIAKVQNRRGFYEKRNCKNKDTANNEKDN